MKWCPGCHGEMPENYAFCIICGTPLISPKNQKEKQCPNCKKAMPQYAEYCSECGLPLGTKVNSEDRKMSFDESVSLIQRLRKVAQDLRYCHSLKKWIIETEARKVSFASRFFLVIISLVALSIVACFLMSEYGGLSKAFAGIISGAMFCIGCIVFGVVLFNVCEQINQNIDKNAVPIKKQLIEMFEYVVKCLDFEGVPNQFRVPEYIDFLADVIDQNKADNLNEAIRLLQYELVDRPRQIAEMRRIEYERQVAEAERRYRQSQEDYLKEAQWLYYIEPTDKY